MGHAGWDLLCNIGHVKLAVLEEDFLDAFLSLCSDTHHRRRAPSSLASAAGRRAEARAASPAKTLFVQLRRTSTSSLAPCWTACACSEISVCAKRMRAPADLSSQASAPSSLCWCGGAQFAVEPKGRVASFPCASAADSEGNEVLNPAGTRTEPCSALMPSKAKRPASNPTHQLPCGKSGSGQRFRKRY